MNRLSLDNNRINKKPFINNDNKQVLSDLDVLSLINSIYLNY